MLTIIVVIGREPRLLRVTSEEELRRAAQLGGGRVYVLLGDPLRLRPLTLREALQLLDGAAPSVRGRRSFIHYFAAVLTGKEPGDVDEDDLERAARYLLRKMELLGKSRFNPVRLEAVVPELREMLRRYPGAPLSYYSLYRFYKKWRRRLGDEA